MAVTSYTTSESLNTDLEGLNIDEGMAPSDVNNALRQILADIAAFEDAPTIKDQSAQSFTLAIQNNGGTIQHLMGGHGSNVAGNFLGKITAANQTAQNTPTGADGSTAMAYGGKISSAATNAFIFDTAAQAIADHIGVMSINYNSTGTDLTVHPLFLSRDVNGATVIRLEFLFFNATTGAAFNLTGIASGKQVQVRAEIHLA